MRYCPKCSAEYRDDVGACSDCGVGLIAAEQWEGIRQARQRETTDEFVPVRTVDDQFAADVLRDALESEGIPVMVRSFSDTPFDGIFIPQKGWGMILVPGEFHGRAENIVALLD